MGVARLAALYGVATEHGPSGGARVPVPEATVVAVLAALGVDAADPSAVRRALDRAESAAARLLPPTVILWRDAPDEPHDTAVPDESHGTAAHHEPHGAAPHKAHDTAGPCEPHAAAPHKAHGTSAPPPPGGPSGIPAAPSSVPPTVPSTDRPAGLPAALDGLPPGTVVRIALEGGGETQSWGRLPHGVHRLTARAPDGRTDRGFLIVAPGRAPQPPGRSHGFLVQLYSLLSTRSWGMGDLGDLAELATWSGRSLGTGFLQVNPLHAAVPGAPGGGTDPSPYRPSSRRFPDPVHLRVESIPEYAYVTGADRERLAELRERAAELRAAVLEEGVLIDRDAVWALKREALELVLRVPLGPGRAAAYRDFLAEQGRALADHATWCALAEVHGPDHHTWPPELRDPRSDATARARRALPDRIDFHTRTAWLTDGQLARAGRAAREAGMAVGIVHDLAVGVHPGGADAWAQGEVFASGMSIGAPPDAFNAHGQDWGLPPWRPDALAASGYAPYRELLRGLLRHAGALRIDHVMGLFRLWWVPEGRPPTEGTYVRYDADAMLAVLVLEAHRAGAIVIGEDLGTVEPGVREALRRRGVLGTSVLWFERDWAGTGRPLPPEAWREGCVATATTHDLPPTAARLTGEHVELRHRLGLLTRPLAEERARERADVREWLLLLQGLGLLEGSQEGEGEGPGDEEERIRAAHRFLLRTPARLVGVWLPDAVGDRRPQNLPGTWDQYPNWRLPIADAGARPLTLEELTASPRLHALMEVFISGAPAGARP
ncbi:4-alpha-glucanotransferase [Streptomyces sp. NPDC020965]|uniref:4-alpha-glucanotransferase n=1 Tax=Streptomyces sp. NPDC020965 TaxID=3365105 RepID=UPI0037AE71CE